MQTADERARKIHQSYIAQQTNSLYVKQNNAAMASYIIKKRKKRAAIIVGVCLVFSFVFLLQIFQCSNDLKQVHAQIFETHQKINKQNKYHNELKKQIIQLHNKDYLEKLIRAKYYYSKPNETIYSFPVSSKANKQY